MAHSYTPGLRITAHTIIRKERRLPLKGEVAVKVGDAVKAEDVVARTALPGNVHTVNVANMLSLPPEDVPTTMLKKEGEEVEKGEMLAQTKSFFGMFKSSARAPISGKVENVSTVTGQVTLREPPIPVEVAAYVDGTVTEVMPEEGVVIETVGALVQGIFGIGGERVGILEMAVDAPGAVADVTSLGDLTGKVVVVGAHAAYDTVMKARDKGAVGIITGGIADADLKRILGYDLGVAITGSEDIGITVICTEGFGTLTIAEKTFNLLKSLNGRKVSINGATQIRAGVMRPELLVPLEEKKGEKVAQDQFAGGLHEGSMVRLIREPNFGEIGQVTELPPELEQVESGAKVRVLRVKMANGAQATVPRANVEMIES